MPPRASSASRDARSVACFEVAGEIDHREFPAALHYAAPPSRVLMLKLAIDAFRIDSRMKDLP